MKFSRPREIGTQLKNFYQALSREQKILGGILILLVVGGLLTLILWKSKTEWGLLYRGLPEETAAEVVHYLKQNHIPFKLEPDGTIRVPKEKVAELRMEIAGQDIVGGVGPGFELFDKGQIGATEFTQKVNYQRALEGELSRTIMGLKAVKYARVHLALPRESLFIEEEKPPKASVFVQLRPGYTLSRKQVLGIVNLVSGAVTGLTPENVKVVDTNGRVLYQGEKEEEEKLSTTQLVYRRKLEEEYRQKVEELLARALGPGKAVAQVSVDLDFNEGIIREEIYDPELTAVVSELLEEANKTSRAPGGPAGVKGALALKAEGNLGIGLQGEVSSSRKIIRNYEPTRTFKEISIRPGKIKRISVAVLIDANVLEGKILPQEGNKPDLEWLEKLVKGAVGYNPDRGDVVEVSTLPFKAEVVKRSPPLLEVLSRLAIPLIQLLIVLLVLLLVVRPLIKALLERMAPTMPEEVVLEAEEEVSIEAEEIKPPHEMALSIVQSNPERAAILIKKWLLEETLEDRSKALKEAV